MAARFTSLLLIIAAYVVIGCQPAIEYLPTPIAVVPTPGALGQGSPPQPMLLEQRHLLLEWPKTIRVKDNDGIVLSILMDPMGNLPTASPDLFATHNIMAVARLEMIGVDAYGEEIREPMTPGRPVNFRWSIQANKAGLYRGVVWLRLELVPKNGGPIDEQLLLARPIEVQAVTVLGLPGDLARILGGLGILLSAGLSYPFIHLKFKDRFEKQARPQPLPPALPEAANEKKEAEGPKVG